MNIFICGSNTWWLRAHDGHNCPRYVGQSAQSNCKCKWQAWDFSLDLIYIFLIENLTLECIKTAVFDTRNPKSPPPTPTPIRSLAKLSSSFLQIFSVSSLKWFVLNMAVCGNPLTVLVCICLCLCLSRVMCMNLCDMCFLYLHVSKCRVQSTLPKSNLLGLQK